MSSPKAEDRLAPYLRRYSPSPSPNRDPDAGLRGLHHYERKLPKWRYRLRQWLIPIVRWETPYLALLQNKCRTHVLDSYFAFTANLGTHTFFMTFLPICFWCGFPDFGLALVHMLALGVVFSGALKDLVCLPRPLSPPLQRITMSGSAALEYGFPSTHTTNAVSVALFGLYQLSQSESDWSPTSYGLLRAGCYCYATSITLGRMYCGMHGFFDVVLGAFLGGLITWIRVAFGSMIDQWIIEGSWTHPAIAVAVLALVVRFHPEPADNCPCFDDSVAFLGVVMGISIGTWQRALDFGVERNQWSSLAKMYAYTNQDLLKSGARLSGGIVVIFVWRALMKPLLLRFLPPLFRFVDHWGVNMPRRYFLQARDYKKVPELRQDDNVIPPASDIPSMLMSLRHPRRRRVSVGPQSEADAREFLANREQRRKQSRSVSGSRRRKNQAASPARSNASDEMTTPNSIPEGGQPDSSEHEIDRNSKGPSSASLQVDTVNRNFLAAPTIDDGASSDSGKEDEKNDREMFSALEKPRTHYDVEVITKLVVYAGIAWIAVEGNPILFKKIGLD